MALFKKESYLGIDIGTSTMKVVELGVRGAKPVLKNYAYTHFESNLVYSKGVAAVSASAKKLAQVLNTAEIKSNKAIMALPGFAVFTTVLELPEMPHEELEKAIRYESKYYIPVPLEEVVLGWHLINPPEKISIIEKITETIGKFGFLVGKKVKKEKRPKRKIQVFVTAAPVDLVKKYTELSKILGLKLLALEAEAFPMIRTLIRGSKEPFLIIDLGSHATTVSIVDNGYLQATHGIDIGGNNITQAISRGMGIDFERAEEFKIRYGISGVKGSEALPGIVRSVFGVIKKEVAHLSKMYYNKSGRGIKKAVLIGGSANLKGLPDYFRRELDLEAKVGNPWEGIEYPPILENRLLELGPRFSVAVGLALKNLQKT